MSVLKIKNNDTFISIPTIAGARGPIGPQGPKGEPGISGTNIKVSSNEPTDTNVEVWINPTATGEIEDLQNAINNMWQVIYPIGSIYLSMNSTNPGLLFGGTWEQVEGRFLLGVGSTTDETGDTRFYDIGATGGEYSHILTESEMPNHTHDFRYGSGANSGGLVWGLPTNNIEEANTTVFKNDTYEALIMRKGGSQSHNNMPPFLAVFMWKRVS